jgi:hypothetical protein
MIELDRLLQALNLQAAAMNDLTNSIAAMADSTNELVEVVKMVMAPDEITVDNGVAYLDGSSGKA